MADVHNQQPMGNMNIDDFRERLNGEIENIFDSVQELEKLEGQVGGEVGEHLDKSITRLQEAVAEIAAADESYPELKENQAQDTGPDKKTPI